MFLKDVPEKYFEYDVTFFAGKTVVIAGWTYITIAIDSFGFIQNDLYAFFCNLAISCDDTYMVHQGYSGF